MNWFTSVLLITVMCGRSAAQSSTTAPRPDVNPEPHVGLYFNATVEANGTISTDCQNKYSDAFRSSLESVCQAATDLISLDQMCPASPSMAVVAADMSFVVTGSKADLAFSTFVIPPDIIPIRECEECSWEVQLYIDDLSNWPTPIIPAVPGCPSTTINPYRYDNGKSNWRCVSD